MKYMCTIIFILYIITLLIIINNIKLITLTAKNNDAMKREVRNRSEESQGGKDVPSPLGLCLAGELLHPADGYELIPGVFLIPGYPLRAPDEIRHSPEPAELTDSPVASGVPPQTFCLRALAACPSPARPKSHPGPPGSQRCCGSTGRAPRPPAEERERSGPAAPRAVGAPGAGDAPHPLQPRPQHVQPSRAPAACRDGLAPGGRQKVSVPKGGNNPGAAATGGKESTSCRGLQGLQRDFLGQQL